MPLSRAAIMRIQNELKELNASNNDGIWVHFNEDDISQLQILIEGPTSTPYEGGFFIFHVEIPENYPFEPPKCTFLTTGRGKVRFNPNLYKNGKICLSILGTWPGPPWTGMMGIRTLCLNFQLLLNETPVRNEPGWEHHGKESEAVRFYNRYLRWFTIKHALIDHMAKKTYLPSKFQTIIDTKVKEQKQYYFGLMKKNEEFRMNEISYDGMIYYRTETEAINYNWSELRQTFKNQWCQTYCENNKACSEFKVENNNTCSTYRFEEADPIKANRKRTAEPVEYDFKKPRSVIK